MDHYICTGTCGAVSDEQGVCQDSNCPEHGQQFQMCSCTDDRHGRTKNDDEYKKFDEQEEM